MPARASDTLRAAIQELGKLGRSIKQISDALQCSTKLVKTWINREDTRDRARAGGRRKIDSNDQKALTRLQHNYKYNTLNKLLPVFNTSLKKRGKEPISRSTLGRATKDTIPKQHPKVDNLSQSNKTARKRYCLVARDNPCIYGDSCTISVSKLQKLQLRSKYPGQLLLKPIKRHSDFTVHLYAFIMDGDTAKSRLVFVMQKTRAQMLASGIPKAQVKATRAFSGEHTREVWLAAAELAAVNSCASNCSFIIDNASQHTGKGGQKMLRDAGIHAQVVPLPPHSPDLNPIEHVWPELQRRSADKMGKKVISNAGQLKRIITAAWKEIPTKLVRDCVRAVAKHKALCIEQEGGGPVC